MKLTDKGFISMWAYEECRKGNDTEDIRSLITHSRWAYKYCLDIGDKHEMWKKIKDYWHAKLYCENIRNRSELRKIYDTKFRRECLKNEINRKI